MNLERLIFHLEAPKRLTYLLINEFIAIKRMFKFFNKIRRK